MEKRNSFVSPNLFVWVGSILQHSAFFAEYEYEKILREQQLKESKELKEKLPDQNSKVRYWIADMFNFEEAKDRLQTPTEAHDVPNFMTRYLGNFLSRVWWLSSLI
jgi:hypothetical protein